MSVYGASSLELLTEIRFGFRRGMGALPGLFGMNRHQFMDWSAGATTPPARCRLKLEELAKAARLFNSEDVHPDPACLCIPLARGKSFLELIAAGADGGKCAALLLRFLKCRGHTAPH
ncbi:MAG: hypothetical protein RLZZ200_1621 [Pseudomonadota bacterium]|jgi:hypothetical protein